MEMTYEFLHADELHGSTQADYLVSLDGDLHLVLGDVAVFDEPGFPVVELARSLQVWLDDPNRINFVFDSMSYEEIGAISILQNSQGWTFRSVFVPKPLTPPMGWTEIERCCRTFIAKVKADLAALGLPPGDILQR